MARVCLGFVFTTAGDPFSVSTVAKPKPKPKPKQALGNDRWLIAARVVSYTCNLIGNVDKFLQR